MPKIKLVISGLHLADSHSIFEGFGDLQQSSDEIRPELIAWLSKTDWNSRPLRNMTQLVFALIRTEEGLPSSVNLCVWQGGEKGTYHVLT